MPEATMICCDCSEYMRNGDLVPNRFDSQIDAVGVIANNKIESNHENTVGLISMGKKGKADVLINCTNDVGRVLSSISKMLIQGSSNILVAIHTAQLALKHRKNKAQDQRIILFVGSPIGKDVTGKDLEKLGKRLKKNNVSVDLISFGETDENKAKLELFYNTVNNSKDESNLIVIPSNSLLSDSLSGSAVLGVSNINAVDSQIEQALAASQVDANPNNNSQNQGSAAPNGAVIPPEYANDPELWEAIQRSLAAENNDDNNDNNNNDNDKNKDNNNSNSNNKNNKNSNDDQLTAAARAMAISQGIDDPPPDLIEAFKLSLLDAQEEKDNDKSNDKSNDNDIVMEQSQSEEQQLQDDIQKMVDVEDEDELEEMLNALVEDGDDLLEQYNDNDDDNDKNKDKDKEKDKDNKK